MNRLAFLTMDSLDGFVSYDHLVRDILQQRGIAVDEVSWRARQVDWDRYNMVVIRSPWDYQLACDDFLNVLAAIEVSRATLQNSLNIVRWNVRKTYLRELEVAGVTIVPTQWLNSPSESELRSLFGSLGCDAIVVKPVVGANADNAFWLRPDSPANLWETAQNTFHGRIAMTQPFVSSVTSHGEVSLIFFQGEYSHSVLKTPKSGDFRVQEEHGGRIQLIEPDSQLIEFARRSLTSVPGQTLYARVDIVTLANGEPAIMELELIEPSLYLSFDSNAPERFADAIEASLKAGD